MLIDRLMPCYDAVRAEHRIIPSDIATVYTATRHANFIRAWRESAAVRLLFAARALGERTVSLIARREHRDPPPPESMRLADMPTHGDWVLLGEDPPRDRVRRHRTLLGRRDRLGADRRRRLRSIHRARLRQDRLQLLA